jgi:hypothetical protein
MLDLLEIHWGFSGSELPEIDVPRGTSNIIPAGTMPTLDNSVATPWWHLSLVQPRFRRAAAADPGLPHREIHRLIRSGRKSFRIHPCIGCQSASASFPAALQPSSRKIGPAGPIRGRTKGATYAWAPFSGGFAKPVNKLFAKKRAPPKWLGGGNQRLRAKGYPSCREDQHIFCEYFGGRFPTGASSRAEMR